MERTRKYLLIVCRGVVILLAIGIALLLASRWLTASESVRHKITAETARLTGGSLSYDRLSLNLIPLPHLSALQVNFQIPGKIALETASLAIYPDIPALLGGTFKLENLVADRPTARIELPRTVAKKASTAATDPLQQFREAVAAAFEGLSRMSPDMHVKLKTGTIVMARAGKPELKIERVDLKLDSDGQVLTLDLGCRTDISERTTLKAKVNREKRSSEGRLKLGGLNARALMAELPPFSGISLSDTRIGIEVIFSSEAFEKIEARVACTVPDVRIQRPGHHLSLQKVFVKGAVRADFEKLSWDIKSFKAGSHGVDIEGSGTFAFGGSKPAALELEATGRRIDVAKVARAFTDFAGDQGWVPTAFNVAREGELTEATCHLVVQKSNGRWVVADLKAAGHLTSGLVTIPGAEIDLEDVNGEVLLDNQRVAFKQMQGRLHFGTFSALNAQIDWHQAATLGISASRASLTLEQFYPWLTAFEGLQDIRKFISAADGDLNLTRLVLNGPLTSPADWRIEVVSGLENVNIISPELDGPLNISRGKASFKPQAIRYDKLYLDYLDADAVMSGTIIGTPGHPKQVDLSMDGTIGKRALAWIRHFKDLPEHLRVKAPVMISGMRLQWDDQSNVAVVGELTTAGGIRAVADVAFTPGRWQINRFELNDGISNVSLKLSQSDQQVTLDYAGKLHKTTLDRFFKKNTILKGWIDGELKASLDMNNMQSSKITGALRGEGLIVQHLPVSPIAFERFFLQCRGTSAHIETADLVFAGLPMQLKGTAGISERAYTFDLDLTADSLDVAALSKIQKAQSPRKGQAKAPVRERVPIDGIIRFKTPRFTFKDYTWTPLHADIAIQSDAVQVTATRADLCGISTPGTITFKPAGADLSFKIAAAKQNLQKTWACLQDKPLQAESVYDLSGRVTSRGPGADLVKNLQGEIFFSSEAGLIHRSNMLTKIFSFLNVTEVFAGKTSGLGEKGFGYDIARAHADIQGGSLNFDEMLVDGHAMKISGEGTVNLIDGTLDVVLLVAPLKTFDRIVRNMPVVGYITGGSILSVPIRVKGRTADPQTVPLPLAAVGRGLVGILERTLKSPLKVVESLPRNKAGDFPVDNQAAGEPGQGSKDRR